MGERPPAAEPSQRAIFERLVEAALAASQEVFGARLVSFAVFGSVGRGAPRPDSDLDIFLVVRELPDGYPERVAEFDGVERALGPQLAAARHEGVTTELSPVLRTPAELTPGTPPLRSDRGRAHPLRSPGHSRRGARRSPPALEGPGGPPHLAWRRLALGSEAGLPPRRGIRDLTNRTLAQSYLAKAWVRLEMLDFLAQREAWSDVVREAQETVEPALKAMLREVGIEPPKWHDVGGALLDFSDRFTPETRKQLPWLARESAWLRKQREAALYGEADLVPTEYYTAEHARRAVAAARQAVAAAGLVIDSDPQPADSV